MKRNVMQLGAGLMVLVAAEAAEAQGLTRAQSTLNSFYGQVMGLLPLVATLAGVVLIALWKTGVIRARTLVQWGAGCALIGSVSEIVKVLMG